MAFGLALDQENIIDKRVQPPSGVQKHSYESLMCQSADSRREREQAAVDMPQDTLICLPFIKCFEVDAC